MDLDQHLPIKKYIRSTIGILLVIISINAFGGGVYGCMGAPDIPLQWLKNSPFNSYLIPSIILFVAVRGTALYAAIAVFRQLTIAPRITIVHTIILCTWISTQLIIIGYVSWLQPFMAFIGILIFILSKWLYKA